jgi:hypothetical protein
MPCNSDYLQASGHELESKRVCSLLVYVNVALGKHPPNWVVKAAKDTYGCVAKLDEATQMLCAECRGMSEDLREKIIYNAHDKTARKLANWWERHQEWDQRRVAEEEEAVKAAELQAAALKKLTPEEREALGLPKNI